jgi:hypothetical protein
MPPLRSECFYPSGFPQALLPVTQLLFCVLQHVSSLERCFAICLGERLGNSQLELQLLLLSCIEFPTLALPFLPYEFGASVVVSIRCKVGLGR